MKRFILPIAFTLVGVLLLTVFALLIKNGNMQLLNPQGYIAQKQSDLLITALVLGLVIGIPVIGSMIFIAVKYKDDQPAADYAPEWKPGKILIASWWIAPAVVVFFWAITGWQTAHQLDPFKPIASNVKPVEIQVVALSWKWLFFYPQEHIATVNYIEFPVNTPVEFHITADNTPYSSFWIPSLGSQIYAMNGMETKLNLIADNQGSFPGEGTEINGDGYSGMDFVAKSTTLSDYHNWVQTTYKTGKTLDRTTYNSLAKPSTYNHPAFYTYADTDMFHKIIMKFMPPGGKVQINNMSI